MLKRKTGKSDNTAKKKLKLTDSQNSIQKPISPVLLINTKSKNLSIHPQAHSSLSAYLKDYKKRLKTKAGKFKRNEKIFIVQGPAGSGKTHFVRQLGSELKLNLLELNGSVNRSKANVVKVLGEATQTFSIEKGKKSGTVIFVDDVDVLLEPDVGFYKGIEFILMSNKCPVVFTCQVVPKFLLGFNAKIFKLDLKDQPRNEALKRLVRRWRPGIGQVEIENLLNRSRWDLNAVANQVRLKEFSWLEGMEVRVVSERSVEVLAPKGLFDGIWDQVQVQGQVDSLELLTGFCDNLQEIDLVESALRKFPIEGKYRLESFYQGLENFYLKHRDPNEEFLLEDGEKMEEFIKITREHLAHMGEIEDYASCLQVFKEFPVLIPSSYLLRYTEKQKSTYFEFFLQKNPNLFKPSQ